MLSDVSFISDHVPFPLSIDSVGDGTVSRSSSFELNSLILAHRIRVIEDVIM